MLENHSRDGNQKEQGQGSGSTHLYPSTYPTTFYIKIDPEPSNSGQNIQDVIQNYPAYESQKFQLP